MGHVLVPGEGTPGNSLRRAGIRGRGGPRVPVVAALLALAVSLLAPTGSGAATFGTSAVAISPDGARVYAGMNGFNFSVFSRDASTGELTLLEGKPLDLSANAGPVSGAGFAFSPDSANVYGADPGANSSGSPPDPQLLQYAPASAGTVEQQSYPISDGTSPVAVVASPDGSSVYALTQLWSYAGATPPAAITAFQRNASTGNLTTGATTIADPHGDGLVRDPVVSPDGKNVYLADLNPTVSGGVVVLGRDTTSGALTVLGDDGNLSGNALAISPDGSFVYEAGRPSAAGASCGNGCVISVLARNGTTGRLTPVSEFDNSSGAVPGLTNMSSVGVSHDGRCLYTTSTSLQGLSSGALGYFMRDTTTGALTFGGVVTGSTVGVIGMGNPQQVTTSPDGKNAYVAAGPAGATVGAQPDNGVAVFSVNPTTCAPTFLQFVEDLFSVGQAVVNPANGTAALPVTTEEGGTLDLSVQPLGTQSSARKAATATQPINVGAGTTNLQITLDQHEQQQLDTLHKLTVRATVTFTASGVSTTKSTTIQLLKTRPSLSKLGVSPSKFSLTGRKVNGRCVAPTSRNSANQRCRRAIKLRVSYKLTAPAPVAVTLKFRTSGRKVGGRCVKPTSKNNQHPKCTRLVEVHGKIFKTGKAGANHFDFNGKIGGHTIRSGSYELIASPTGGNPKTITFTIAP